MPFFPTILRFFRFVLCVLSGFRRNNGFLMAGAVAYTFLLSIIPLFAVVFVSLSRFFDNRVILDTVSNYLKFFVPGPSQALVAQIATFIDHREIFSGISLIILLFFSSMAFSVLESALCHIFATNEPHQKRRFWVSAIIPYLYIALITLAILLLTTFKTVLDAISNKIPTVFGFAIPYDGLYGWLIYIFGLFGMALIFMSLYSIMPVRRVPFRHAILGGLTAALLWEIVRHILVWYFAKISMVNVIYGSLATVIIVLLSFEIAAIIILLGAQVIAELGHSFEVANESASKAASKAANETPSSF